MSSPDSAIRSAFTTKLLSLSSLPSVAWENMPFTPAGATYLVPTLMTGEPIQAEIGDAGCNRHTGIYQISIFSPAGVGVSLINNLRDGIVDHFKRGTVLIYGSVRLTIQKSYAGPMMQETDWVNLPITIQYQLLAAN